MVMAHRALLVGVALGILVIGASACLKPPKHNYSIAEIGHLESLEEIMRVQAATMDPLFAKRKNPSFSALELGQIAQAARKIQATSVLLRDRIGPQRRSGFIQLAVQLNNQAKALEEVAGGTDLPRVGRALINMRDTCRRCHKAHRD